MRATIVILLFQFLVSLLFLIGSEENISITLFYMIMYFYTLFYTRITV